MKTIVLSEEQEKMLISHMVTEEVCGWSDKVDLIKRYLDNNFVRADVTTIGKDGAPEQTKVVGWLDGNKKIVKTLTDVQLFYFLQDKFKNIFIDKEQRDKFIKQVMKDWYDKKISKYNTLSLY